MDNVCSKCGSMEVKLTPDNYGLIVLRKDSETQYMVDASKVMPIKPKVCSNCGYIELFFNPKFV